MRNLLSLAAHINRCSSMLSRTTGGWLRADSINSRGRKGRPRSGRAHTDPLSVVPPQRNAHTGGGQDGRRWAVEVDHARVDAAFGDTKNRVALMRLLPAQLKDVRRDESSSEQLS